MTSADNGPSTYHQHLRDLRANLERGRRRRLTSGLGLPFRALRFLLGTPGIWGWAVLPALINIALFALTIWLLFRQSFGWLSHFWTRPEVSIWYDWLLLGLWHLVVTVVFVVAAVIAYFLVLMLAGVVGSPAQDKLSEQTEQYLTGNIADARPGEAVWIGALRSLGTSLSTLGIYLAIMACLLTLNLIPLAGSIAYSVLAWAVSFYFLTLEYAEGTLDRQGLLYRQRLTLLRSHGDVVAGFGAGLTALLFVPVLNLLVMPIAIVAGTMLGLALIPRAGDATDPDVD